MYIASESESNNVDFPEHTFCFACNLRLDRGVAGALGVAFKPAVVLQW